MEQKLSKKSLSLVLKDIIMAFLITYGNIFKEVHSEICRGIMTKCVESAFKYINKGEN